MLQKYTYKTSYGTIKQINETVSDRTTGHYPGHQNFVRNIILLFLNNYGHKNPHTL